MNRIRQGVTNFTTAHNIPDEMRRKIVAALNVRTVAAFKSAVGECTDWLASRVQQQRYALIVMNHHHHPDSQGAITSSEWLAHRVIARLGPPAAVVEWDGQGEFENDHLTDANTMQTPRGIKSALSKGIRTFVYLDDAIYSGSQMSALILNMVTHLEHKENSPPYRYSDPNAQKKWAASALFVTAPFTTAAAEERVRGDLEYAPSRSEAFFPHTVPAMPANVAAYAEGRGFLRGATMTAMPYKIPDSWSFGFATGAHTHHGIYNNSLNKAIMKRGVGIPPYHSVRATSRRLQR